MDGTPCGYWALRAFDAAAHGTQLRYVVTARADGAEYVLLLGGARVAGTAAISAGRHELRIVPAGFGGTLRVFDVTLNAK